MPLHLSFFGAAGCVTGSCMLLETDASRVLIDCGLFQGPKTLKALNYGAFPFSADEIDAVLLTHAHVDHSGLLPKLMLAGFKGEIYTTAGTRDLCGVLLPDAGAIQEMEVEALNKRNLRHGKPEVSPIYTAADAEAVLDQFEIVPLETWTEVAQGIRARWWHAGHILGAASIEVEVTADGETQTLLFSGDVGPGGRSFSDDPAGPAGVDHLIIESTYGDKDRDSVTDEERKQLLGAELSAAFAAGGPLVIPAFAVERTQELIVDLLELMETDRAPPAPIFLDSPLAIRASEVFLRHDDDGAAFERLRESRWLKFTEEVRESRALERMSGWHIIIAASGMCDAGRIRHHLKRLLWRAETTVMLTGYQAIGTLGRLLQDGKRAVRIQGDDVKVAARIRSIDVYSGHADAAGLVRWAKDRAPVRGAAFITHGEPENANGLLRRLSASGIAAGRVHTAEMDQTYRLTAAGAEPQTRIKPRISAAAAARLDWHNARSDFLARLNEKLDAAADDAEREAIIAELARRLP